MRVALGYRFYPAALGFHMERAFRSLGHDVVYLGLPAPERPGYDSPVNVSDIITTMEPRPDLFFWIDPAGPYFPPGIETLPIPSACYLVDVHLGRWRQEAARFFDAVFIAQKEYVDPYTEAVGHRQVAWLPLAYAPDVHEKPGLERVYEVGFVGNLALAHRRTSRARYLRLLHRRFVTNDFYGRYSPEEVGRVYGSAKIVFNASISGDVNMRVFEGTGGGAMVLTDFTGNGLGELFDVGREIVTYSSEKDLLDKIGYFLIHEKERAEIARAGQERASTNHTYRHRVRSIVDYVTGHGFTMCAPMRAGSTRDRSKARLAVYTHLHMVDTILSAARDADKGAFGRIKDTLPALIRRLVI